MLNSKNRQPVPGPLCAAYAPLLPALDDLTDARLAEDTRAHLADCAWCRAQRATYDRFDEALRLHFAPDAMPVLSENLAASLLGDANYDGGLATLVVPDEESLDDDVHDDDGLDITVTPLPIPPRSPHRPRRSLRLAALGASLAAMLVISLLGGLLFLSHERLTPPASPHATAQTTATTVPKGFVTFNAIGMASATDGWAFSQSSSGTDVIQTSILHYTGGRWVETPTRLLGSIAAVKMLSPDDGWAVGDKIYHYEGTHWLEMNDHLPDYAGATFNALSVVSSTDVWFAGAYYGGQTLILHYDGHTWTQQRTPPIASGDSIAINSIAMVSATEGWAVGTATHSVDCSNSHNNNCGVNTSTTGVVLHYANGAWQVALTLPNYDLSAISMVSASEGWFGGQKQARNASFPAIGPTWNKPTLWHYGGSHWVEVSPPQAAASGVGDPVGQIKSITMFSAMDGWLFASLMDQPQPGDGATPISPDVFHLEQGRWVAIKTPAIKNRVEVTMFQVGFVSLDEFWGIGESLVPDLSTGSVAHVVPLLVHYKGGVWNVVEG